MKYFLPLLLLFNITTLYAQQTSDTFGFIFTKEIAAGLAALPLHCIVREFPNKTGHTSDSSTDHVLLPHEIHPSFYGCFDWHSSVHGHWMLVKILKSFPGIAGKENIIATLSGSFQPEKLKEEADYFSKYKTSTSYERTYGWAWLLKLDEELFTWDDPLARQWYKNLQPLTQKVIALWTAFLPKQTYPNRTGVHPNTAFGLSLALDWARTLKNDTFEMIVKQKSLEYYGANKNIPASYEPDGSDFFSPSLEVADLMRRVMPVKEFIPWLATFYNKEGINRIIQQPVVSDRTDLQIVHLDGLSLSRAWCMKGIAGVLPASHPYKKLFIQTAAKFLHTALPNVTSGNYGGDHWLASFAVYAMLEGSEEIR